MWGRDLNAAMAAFEASISSDRTPEGFLGKLKLLQMR